MPTLTFKVSAEEAQRIRAKARAERATLSASLRQSALGDPAKPAKIVRRKHPVSGLTYNAAPGRVVTDEDIRAALADFP